MLLGAGGVVRPAARGAASNNGRGVGLSNVRGRLQQLYGANHKFELNNNAAGGLTVSLEIPFAAEIEDSPVVL